MKWTLINSPLDDNFCECFGCSWLSLSLLSLLRHQDKYNINNTFDWSALRAAGPRARCHPFTPSALQDYYFFLPHKHFVSYNRMAQNKTGEKLLPIETSVKKKEIRPFLVEPLLFYWVVDNLSIFQVVRPLWQHSDRCALFTLNSKASWLFVIDAGHVYIRASDVWSLYNVATPIVPSNKKRWKRRSALRYLSSFRSSLLVGYRQNFTSLVPTTCVHLKRNSRRAGRFNSCVSIYLPPPPTFGCRKMSSFSSFTTLQKKTGSVCLGPCLCVCVWITGLGRSWSSTSTKRGCSVRLWPTEPFSSLSLQTENKTKEQHPVSRTFDGEEKLKLLDPIKEIKAQSIAAKRIILEVEVFFFFFS